MDNTTACSSINNKIINTHSYPGTIDNSGVAISVAQVNSTPLSMFHLQNCYRDTRNLTGQFFILDPNGEQVLPKGLVNTEMGIPLIGTGIIMNRNRAWGVADNSFSGIYHTIELTLVDMNNNEVKEQIDTSRSYVSVFTKKSVYRHCNDIRIISKTNLSPGQFISSFPDNRTPTANLITNTIGVNYKYNPVFMCCNMSDGTLRNARLVGLPQIYSAVATDFMLFKWLSADQLAAVSTVCFTVSRVNSANPSAPGLTRRIHIPDGAVNLEPGDWVAWWRSAHSNAIAAITAKWEYYLV